MAFACWPRSAHPSCVSSSEREARSPLSPTSFLALAPSLSSSRPQTQMLDRRLWLVNNKQSIDQFIFIDPLIPGIHRTRINSTIDTGTRHLRRAPIESNRSERPANVSSCLLQRERRRSSRRAAAAAAKGGGAAATGKRKRRGPENRPTGGGWRTWRPWTGSSTSRAVARCVFAIAIQNNCVGRC